LINKVTSGLRFQINVSYSDDLVITGVSEPSAHIKCVNVLLQRIFASGLRISIVKCLLFQKELPYLGYLITDDGIKPSPDNIKKLANLVIKDAKVMRSFLGMSGYYRRFIKNYAQIVLPIRTLLAGTVYKKHFNNPDILAAVESIKACLLSEPILRHPDFDKLFYLYTDASRAGFGFALMQMHDKVMHVVRYGSCGLPKLKSLNVQDSNLLEVASASWSVHKNLVYLARTKFIIRTDAQIMKYLAKRDLSDAIMSYVVLLNAYEFDVQTIAGTTNFSADMMSRDGSYDAADESKTEEMESRFYLNSAIIKSQGNMSNLAIAPPPPTEDISSDVESYVISYELWVLHQSYDPVISTLKKQLTNEEQILDYVLENGLVFRKPAEGKTRLRVYVPESLRALVVTNTHIYLGHRGSDTAIKILCARTYWPDMCTYIRTKLKTCVECARRKPNFSKKQGLTRRVVAKAPMEWLCMDFMGPLTPSKKENFRYILMVVDVFSRYPWALPLVDKTSDSVAQALMNGIFCFFGLPKAIHSDNEKSLCSKSLSAIFRSLGVRRTSTTVRNPNGNSPVERFNRFLNEHITVVLDGYEGWPQHLPSLLFGYRCTSTSLGYSPCFLMTGREPTLPFDVSLCPTSEQLQAAEPECNDVDSHVFQLNERLRTAFDKVRDLQQRRSDARALRRDEDQKRIAVSFAVGELVGLYEFDSILNRVDYAKPGHYNKKVAYARKQWQFNYTGPHEIIAITNNPNTCVIQHNVRGALTVNVHHLKPWPSDQPDGFMRKEKRFKPPFHDLPLPYEKVQNGELVVVYIPQAAGKCRVAKVLSIQEEDIIVWWYGCFTHTKPLDDVLIQHKWEPIWVDPKDGRSYAKVCALNPKHSKHTNVDFPVTPLTCKDIILRNVLLKPNGKLPAKQAEHANINLQAIIQERNHTNYRPPQAAEIFMALNIPMMS